MNNLTYWAKDHPAAARLIIVLCHFLTYGIIGLSAIVFFVFDLQINLLWVIVPTIFFTCGFLFFPSGKGTKDNLVRRRRHHLAMGMSYPLILFIFLLSSIHHFTTFSEAPKPILIVQQAAKGEASIFKKVKHFVKEKVQLAKKKLLLLKAIQDNKEDYPNNFIPLVLFTFIAINFLLALAVVIAAFGCNLSCSGMGILAGIVFIGGWGVSLGLFIVLMMKLWKDFDKPLTEKNFLG